jgi:hypothetical protein
MKLRECSAEAFTTLPKLSRDEVKRLWVQDFYDGPLAGMVRFNGELAWYVLAEEEQEPYSGGWYRRYWLIRLSPEQVAEEIKWRYLFHTHVSTYGDAEIPEGERAVRPQSEWSKFYEPHSQRAPLVLDENEVLGWFESEVLHIKSIDS